MNKFLPSDTNQAERRTFRTVAESARVWLPEELFASELLSPGSACPVSQIRYHQWRIANRIDGAKS